MVRNAAIVVILVKNIGINNESMVDATAVLTFFPALISRKNFVTTWTPSEFAMVKRIIGIDVLSNAKRNRSDPVMLYIQPMKPIMDTKENPITINTIITPGKLLRFNKSITTIMRMPTLINDCTSSRINWGTEPVI